MDAVIIYESLTGTTQRAAHLIGDGFFDHQIGTQIYPLKGVNTEAVQSIADAGLIIVGTWTDGALIIGQKPGRHKKLKQLPDLSGKNCLVFCTYAIHPGRTIPKLTKIVADLGGNVLGGMTFRRDHLVEDSAEFVARAVANPAVMPRQG